MGDDQLIQTRRRDVSHIAELIKANNLFQAVYDQGVFMGRLDLDGRVIDVNRSALELCGFTRDEIIGKRFWDCGWWNRSLAVQSWVKAGFEQAVAGEPFRGVTAYFCADGSERVVEFAVLLDIGLPGMDGYEVATRMRKEPSNQGTVIVAVSGYGQEEDRRQSKAAGFDHHLIKPLDHDALLSLLSQGGNRGG